MSISIPPAGRRASTLVVCGALLVLLPVCLPVGEPVSFGPLVLSPEVVVLLAAARFCDNPVTMALPIDAVFEAEAEGANESKRREVSAGEALAEAELVPWNPSFSFGTDSR